MSKASRRFKGRARNWNRHHSETKQNNFVNPRGSGSMKEYRAHGRRTRKHGEDIFSLFW